MRLKVSQAAANDLEGIWLYTLEHWSLEQADRYLGLLMEGSELIRTDPACGRDYSHVREGYWCLKVGAHVIFYRLNEAHDAIEVVRVLHRRMDLETRLSP